MSEDIAGKLCGLLKLLSVQEVELARIYSCVRFRGRWEEGRNI